MDFYVLHYFFFISCCLRLGSTDDCDKAPTPAMRKYCEKISRLAQKERISDATVKGFKCPLQHNSHRYVRAMYDPNGPPPLPCILNIPTPTVGSGLGGMVTLGLGSADDPTISDCRTLSCLCKRMKKEYNTSIDDNDVCVLENGQTLRKAIRKEYRTLTNEERKRFHAAVNKLKTKFEVNLKFSVLDNDIAVNITVFDHFAKHHYDVAVLARTAAHGGPGFLPWHREFLKRFEIALRWMDPEVAIPYWDSVLDNNLPDSRDSIIWTDEFLGTMDKNGSIVTGPFAGWKALNGSLLRRNIGVFSDELINEGQLWNVSKQQDVDRVLGVRGQNATDNCHIKDPNEVFNTIELVHAQVHNFVGGHMGELETAANDPAFYLLHSFVDFIWESWRKQKQDRYERENLYARDSIECTTTSHFSNSTMEPWFGWKNKHGLGNFYTDNLYDYTPRPICPDCGGTKYLFCDNSKSRPVCVSKIKLGGNCTGFYNGDTPCYNGWCRNMDGTNDVPEPQKLMGSDGKPCNRCRRGSCVAGQSITNPTSNISENRIVFAGNLERKPSLNPSRQTTKLLHTTPILPRQTTKSLHTTTPIPPHNLPQQITPRSSQLQSQVTHRPSTNVDIFRNAPILGTNIRPFMCSNFECHDANLCCPLWALQGLCLENPSWMSCNCRLSCGFCNTFKNYRDSSVCIDSREECFEWSRYGHCVKNPGYMLDNCRQSCRVCLSLVELQLVCA